MHAAVTVTANNPHASLLAKSLIVSIHIEITPNYHNKNMALRPALKERLRASRNWSIGPTQGQRETLAEVGLKILPLFPVPGDQLIFSLSLTLTPTLIIHDPFPGHSTINTHGLHPFDVVARGFNAIQNLSLFSCGPISMISANAP